MGVMVTSRNPPLLVGAKLRLHIHELLPLWNLALLVDHPTCCPAPKLNPRRPLQRLHLFIVERVTIVAPEVTNPIQKDIVPRREATNLQLVSLRARFPRR